MQLCQSFVWERQCMTSTTRSCCSIHVSYVVWQISMPVSHTQNYASVNCQQLISTLVLHTVLFQQYDNQEI